MTRRPVVLIVTDGYPPATRGGSLRAVAALTAQLSETIDFRILARDHDVVTGTRWPVPSSDDWVEIDGVQVRYCSRQQMSASRLRDHIREIAPDTIYANSLFATPVQWLLWLRRAGLLPPHRLILAPEGEFSPGARQQKAFKKRAYLTVTKGWDLYRDVTWKAASVIEREDIIREMPGARVKLVPSLREATDNSERRYCEPGQGRRALPPAFPFAYCASQESGRRHRTGDGRTAGNAPVDCRSHRRCSILVEVPGHDRRHACRRFGIL